jgi:hypothetical protein
MYYINIYTHTHARARRVQKETEIFKYRARQRAQRARCCYWAHLASGFDNKLPFVAIALRISRRATSGELSTCTSCSLDLWQWKNLKNNVCVCVWNFGANLVKCLKRYFSRSTKHTCRTLWKGLLDQKGRIIRSKIKVILVMLFDWKGFVHLDFIPRGQMVKKQFYLGTFSAFEGCCAQEQLWNVGKADLDFAPRQWAGSRVAPHPQLSGKTSDIRCAPSTLFSGIKPQYTFSCFPNLKKAWKDVFSKPWRRLRKT